VLGGGGTLKVCSSKAIAQRHRTHNLRPSPYRLQHTRPPKEHVKLIHGTPSTGFRLPPNPFLVLLPLLRSLTFLLVIVCREQNWKGCR
jgi:hypothetical protein